MSDDIKHDGKCCETCLNRASFSDNRYMCCKDCYEDLSAYGVPKELPDEHVCDEYSPDIANNPSLREPKSDTEISGFMDIFHEIENTDDLPCTDGLTCNECDYFTKEDGRFMIDGMCSYYGIYLYDFVKHEACQHFKRCEDNSSHTCDADSITEPVLSDEEASKSGNVSDEKSEPRNTDDSYFKSFKAINDDRADEELADHYDSIDAMFKKDVEKVECGDSEHTPISDNNDKPPLGIKPPYVFASERISDICEAILRLNQESVIVDTDTIRSYASELCAISDYLDACMK